MTAASDSPSVKEMAKLAEDTLPAYEADDDPLTGRQLAAVEADANQHLPGGRVLSESSLFS